MQFYGINNSAGTLWRPLGVMVTARTLMFLFVGTAIGFV
jgi:hypothetical protein